LVTENTLSIEPTESLGLWWPTDQSSPDSQQSKRCKKCVCNRPIQSAE